MLMICSPPVTKGPNEMGSLINLVYPDLSALCAGEFHIALYLHVVTLVVRNDVGEYMELYFGPVLIISIPIFLLIMKH